MKSAVVVVWNFNASTGIHQWMSGREYQKFGSGVELTPLRCLSAILLLGVFSSSLIVPVVSADPKPKLPACCRPDGKHRCSMMAATESPESGAVIRNAAAKCPFFPTEKSTPAAAKASVPAPSPQIWVPAVRHCDAVEQAEARYRVSFSRTRQKRGPPSFLS